MKQKCDYKLFILFVGILFLAIFSFGYGNDYFWHVKAGEYIVKNLRIPYYDIFSWYGISNHLYWISHEWLSEVVLYLYTFIFKEFGPFLFSVSMLFILGCLLFKLNQEKLSKNILFTMLWAFIGTLTFSRVMLPRPHMISYILFALTIYLLYDNFNSNSNKIYFLPIISFLWANFHGGSSNLVYLLCFIFFIVGLFQFQFGKISAKRITKQQLKKFLFVGVLSFLVLIINPHGVKMLSYPYINIQDSLMINSIVEWASPSLNNPSDYFDFLLLGTVILCMIITKKKINLIDFVMLGMFLVLGFKSGRFIPLLYIASSFIVFDFVKEYKMKYTKVLFLSSLVYMVLLACLLSIKLVNNYHEEKISNEVIQYIKEKNPSRIYNYYDFGGYLIYHDIKVFIDGRADMYSSNILSDAMDIQNYGYHFLLDKYDFDMFVIPYNIPLNTYLSTNSDYYQSNGDNYVVIYEKINNERP